MNGTREITLRQAQGERILGHLSSYEIPKSVYRAPIVRAVTAMAITILAISFISVLVGSQAARRLARAVATLTATRSPEHPRPVIAEVEEIREVLAEAAAARKAADSARRESEQRLRNLFEQAADGIFVITPDHRYVDANEAGLKMLGYSREELPGLHVSDVLVEGERSRLDVEVPAMMAGTPHLAEWVHRRKDGTTFPAEVSARPISGSEYLAIVRDLTERRRAEEALRERDRFIGAIADTAPAIIYVYDMTSLSNVYANAGIPRLLGYSQVEISAPGAELFDRLIHPDDLPGMIAFQSRILAARDEDMLEIEYRMKHRNGTWRTLRSYERPFKRNPDGSVTQKIGIAIDISERKRVAEELRESEERYRNLLEVAPVGIAVHSEGKIVFTNPAGARLLGADTEEGVVGKPITEIIHPDGLPEAQDRIRRMLAGESGLYPAEDVYLRLDGTPVNVEVMATLLKYRGRPAVQVIVTDITERKRTEDALRVSEANLRKAQEIAKMGSWLISLSDGTISWSDEMYRIYGVSPETFTPNAESFINLIHPDDRPAMDKWIRAYFAGEVPDEVEFRAVLPDGTVHFIRAQGGQLADADGKTTHMVGTAQDITEHRRLEDQLRQAQKLEGIGQLAGGIAHDFNNVLGVVMGIAGILRLRMSEDDPLRHFTDELVAAGERGANLTRQILAFSRKQVFDCKPVRLNGIVRGLEKMLRRLLPESIEISHDLHQEDPVALVDVGQIEQVLINLATNARDAITGIGRISIATGRFTMDGSFVESHGYGEPGEYGVLAVTDTGHGMDAATRNRIFEPFFTTKELGKGTGLGLAVVYGIVKQHRGFINVYSEVGKGTVIRIYLPLAAGAFTVPTTTDPAAREAGGNETILVAEDDEILRKLTRTVLGQYGYTVIEALDGEDAVAKFAANKDTIRLVILDGLMPKKSGVEALEEIRRERPGIKAVFMSGYSNDIFSGDGLRDKGAAFIQKPVMPTDLLRKVREVLDS